MKLEKYTKKESFHEMWEHCWRDNRDNNMTVLGKIITVSKRKMLAQTIKEIDAFNVIDVGCGLGFSLKVFQESGFKAMGVDISKTAIDVCKSKGLTVFHKGVENIVQKYDLVFSDGLLEHFINFEKYAKELMRVSQNYVLIIQSDHETVTMRLLLLLEQILRKGRNMYEYNYRMQDFIDVFRKNGFELIKTKSVFFHCFKLMLFKRKGMGN